MSNYIVKVHSFEYDKRELLGRGAFGKVFRGKFSLIPEKEVAIKVMNARTEEELEEKKESVEREAEALKRVRHANIVTFYDCFDVALKFYIIMKFCNGGDLYTFQQKKPEKVLEEAIVVRLLRHIGAALSALHNAVPRIIHRDIKPENIMLQFGGSGPQQSELTNITFKLSDFGIARFLNEGSILRRSWQGTRNYIASEVLFMSSYESPCDIWSLGVTAFKCLTNTFPCDEATVKRCYFKKSELPLNDMVSYPQVSQPMKQLIKQMLSIKPQDRCSSGQICNFDWGTGQGSSGSGVNKELPKSKIELVRRGEKEEEMGEMARQLEEAKSRIRELEVTLKERQRKEQMLYAIGQSGHDIDDLII